jgi:hypothetical protein
MSHRSSIWCVQNDFQAYGTFDANLAPILRHDRHYLQTDRNESPHDLHHLGVRYGVSKMISEPIVCSVQTVHRSCVKICTISEWTERASS